MKRNLNSQYFRIFSKTAFNADFINDRTRRFIRNTKFDSRYIAILFKASADNNSFWRTVGRRTIIDLTSKNDIDKYIKQLINNFRGFDDWYNGLVPEKIHFEWRAKPQCRRIRL